MWLSKQFWLELVSLIVVVGGIALVAGLMLWATADSARLQPDRREVLVREVDNGYVIQYKTANNPYPVRESVAHDAVVAAQHVQDYLKAKLPETQWGR